MKRIPQQCCASRGLLEEAKNLWNSPEHRTEKERLKKVLSDWFVTSTVRATGWWKNPAATLKADS
jgi:arylsulfatase